ncbi:MAG: tetratricopeptide repeat protein [Myxococcales bacterium]|nr:tetratricopeptide repeat protein [Myxococcales bacterium]MDD9970175.1 tetratricopeptide repeat protein [Myxococcales bacterium]
MASSERHAIDLSEVRADGWLEQLGQGIVEFDQLCEAIGTRFVAFSFIANERITAIAFDPQSPDRSTVDFVVGDGEPQQLSLSEFREQLGAVLVNAPAPTAELGDEPDLDTVRAHIGQRFLLLAPVFGISLLELHHGGDDEPSITVELGGTREQLSVESLREILNNAIRSEVARARPAAPFSIDFKKIPLAEDANRRGDYDQTVSLLGAWPGPLSMFLRTAQGQALGASERGKLMRALCVLGEAYLCKGQSEWAEDVLRLGIQFGQELSESGPLFGVLGRSRVETGRYGEAIGLLRRALALGGEAPELMQMLATCYLKRGRCVAAMACLDEAEALGCDEDDLTLLRSAIREALGPAYVGFRELMAEVD